MAKEFSPDWTMAPGDMLRAVLKERGMTAESLCLSPAALPLVTVNAILTAVEPVTEDIAIRISSATGVPSSFWLNAEAHYRADLAAGRTRSASEVPGG
jgi:plasmid maintenance system antidote protein VapI